MNTMNRNVWRYNDSSKPKKAHRKPAPKTGGITAPRRYKQKQQSLENDDTKYKTTESFSARPKNKTIVFES